MRVRLPLERWKALISAETFPQLLLPGADGLAVAWHSVQVNVGTGSSGFSIGDNGGLQWDAAKGFGGWLGESQVLFLFCCVLFFQPLLSHQS